MAILTQEKRREAEKIYSEIDQLETEVERLQKSKELQFTKEEIRELVFEAFQKLKKEGKDYITVIDLHFETRLPFDKINAAIKSLEKNGRRKSHEDD